MVTNGSGPTRGRNGSTSPSGLSAGHLVAGRYQIVRHIGSGGAGDVFEALDTSLGGSVALKALRSSLAGSVIHLERFRREIQNARKVTHPNVCRIFDLGVERSAGGECFFLTMELLPGHTLAERMKSTTPFTTTEALPIATQIAEGLQAAHDAGIVHRDLKPGNIILVDVTRAANQAGGPRAVVTDFGIALSSDQDDMRLTQSGELVGTPEYMAPEQLDPGPAQPTTDIYALGLILYEMLTARRPFDAAETALASVLMRRREPPHPLGQLLPAIDPAWETTIMRCIERDPARRFPRAADIAAALRRGTPPPSSPGGGVLGRLRRRLGGRPR